MRDKIATLEAELHAAQEKLQVLDEILKLPALPPGETLGGKTEQDYILMQQEHYNDPGRTPEGIVGNYEWHEEFPYETFLLYRNGDIRKPVFESTADKVALEEWSTVCAVGSRR